MGSLYKQTQFEAVSSLKCQVSSWSTLRRVLGVFPLQTLHLVPQRTIRRLGALSDSQRNAGSSEGIVQNKPNLRQTNPIQPRPADTPEFPDAKTCKTNPISGRARQAGPATGERKSAKRTQSGLGGAGIRGTNVQNEPNLDLPGGIGGASGAPNAIHGVWEPDPPYREARSRQTNPIPPGAQTRRCSRRGRRAKRTQFAAVGQLVSSVRRGE